MLPCMMQLRSVVFRKVTVRSGQQSNVALAAICASSRSHTRMGLNVAMLGPPYSVLQLFSAYRRTVVSQSTVPCRYVCEMVCPRFV